MERTSHRESATTDRELDLDVLAQDLRSRLGLEFSPVGFGYAPTPPPAARVVRGGCIAPLVRAAGQGHTYVFDPQAGGRPCARFYLGFSEWIFDGIEQFLSYGPVPDRECERFIRTPEQARLFIENNRFDAPANTVGVLAPLDAFPTANPPQVVVLLVNADQVSALVYLLHFDAPEDDSRVMTTLAAGCASMLTLPFLDDRRGVRRARWGLHDPAARVRMPAHLTSLAMPLPFLRETWGHASDSFLETSTGRALLARRDGK
jgi:hypothetical protein